MNLTQMLLLLQEILLLLLEDFYCCNCFYLCFYRGLKFVGFKNMASLAELIHNDKSVFGNFTQVVWGTSLNEQPMNCRIIA